MIVLSSPYRFNSAFFRLVFIFSTLKCPPYLQSDDRKALWDKCNVTMATTALFVCSVIYFSLFLFLFSFLFPFNLDSKIPYFQPCEPVIHFAFIKPDILF